MTVPDSSEESLNTIFTSILKGFLKVNMFRKEIIDIAEGGFVV